MPRDDIHNATDLMRVINNEVPTSQNVITTPIGMGRFNARTQVGRTEVMVAQAAIMEIFSPENAANGYTPDDKERLDFRLQTEGERYQRVKAAVTAGERANRYR